MGMYVYQCVPCDITQEIIHPMNDKMTYVCCGCQGPMEKMITAPKGIRMTARALNSATGKPYDLKSKTSTYSWSGKSDG